jgi:hypothetical protein
MVTIRESAHFENDEGIWLAIAAGQWEAVRARVSRAEAEQPPEVSLWWDGSATAHTVKNWVAETIGLLNPKLECQVTVWADHAPKARSYRIDNVGRIADDIQPWANDGAVACSISEDPQAHDLVYMWAELKPSNGLTHPGEVGLQYDAKLLEHSYGKRVFSQLLVHTARRRFSAGEIELLCNVLAETVATAASHMSAQPVAVAAAASF